MPYSVPPLVILDLGPFLKARNRGYMRRIVPPRSDHDGVEVFLPPGRFDSWRVVDLFGLAELNLPYAIDFSQRLHLGSVGRREVGALVERFIIRIETVMCRICADVSLNLVHWGQSVQHVRYHCDSHR